MTEIFKGLRTRVLFATPIDQGGTVPDRSLSATVRAAHRGFSRALQAKVSNHGVSIGQWFFLRALWETDGLTQRELSQRVGMMEPTTVTALNGMERRGLVQRVRNPHDRRKVNIFLTPKGRSLRDVLLPCAAEINEQALRGVSAADLERALDVLQTVIGNLADMAAEMSDGGTAGSSGVTDPADDSDLGDPD